MDTIDLVRYANEQINREDSPVKSVVVDLSNNGGGIEPDVTLTKTESYYDREALVEYLHELK